MTRYREDRLPRRIRNRLASEYAEAPQRYAARWAQAAAVGGNGLGRFGQRIEKPAKRTT